MIFFCTIIGNVEQLEQTMHRFVTRLLFDRQPEKGSRKQSYADTLIPPAIEVSVDWIVGSLPTPQSCSHDPSTHFFPLSQSSRKQVPDDIFALLCHDKKEILVSKTSRKGKEDTRKQTYYNLLLCGKEEEATAASSTSTAKREVKRGRKPGDSTKQGGKVAQGKKKQRRLRSTAGLQMPTE